MLQVQLQGLLQKHKRAAAYRSFFIPGSMPVSWFTVIFFVYGQTVCSGLIPVLFRSYSVLIKAGFRLMYK